MKRVDVRKRQRLLDDFFKIDEAEVAFERFDGAMTTPVRRLVFERGDSAAAIVSEHGTGQLLFTEQFRFPTLEKGPGWLLEAVAGAVDPGEPPEATIRREIEEELGYHAGTVEHIATFYVSPGGTSERIWLYYAETTAEGRIAPGGGLAYEHEDIRVVSLSRDEARAALTDGRVPDAKTIIGLQWLFARHR